MLFFTILSYSLLALFSVRIAAIIFGERSVQEEMLIAAAEKRGLSPKFDALKVPIVVVVICGAWILSTWF